MDFHWSNYTYGTFHVALHYGAPLEVIQLLLDHDIEKKTLLVKAFGGSLSFHIACVT